MKLKMVCSEMEDMIVLPVQEIIAKCKKIQGCIFRKGESFAGTMYNIYWLSRVVATELKVERSGSHRKLLWSEN